MHTGADDDNIVAGLQVVDSPHAHRDYGM
jgi:hypothetical protein